MKQTVVAPDERAWIVQRVWWPRSAQVDLHAEIARSPYSSGAGLPVALAVLMIKALLWPFVLGARVILRRSWLVEAFPADGLGSGGAWKVPGLAQSADAVRSIADGISAGNRSPAPHGAVPVAFRAPRYAQRSRRALYVDLSVALTAVCVAVSLIAFNSTGNSKRPAAAKAPSVATSFVRSVEQGDLSAASQLLYPGTGLDEQAARSLRDELVGRHVTLTPSLDASAHLAINAIGGVGGEPLPDGSRAFTFDAGPNAISVVLAPYGGEWRVWLYGG